MAYLVNAKNYFLSYNTTTSTIAFLPCNDASVNGNENEVITISFVPVDQPSIVTNSLAPQLRYYLRIWYPSLENVFSTSYVQCNNVSLNEASIWYLTTGLDKTQDLTNALVFQIYTPLGNAIRLNNVILASLDGIRSTYTLLPSADYAKVGYTQSLPYTLGSCNTYGCPLGFQCNGFGSCIAIKPFCGPNAICSGPCYGRCPTNSSCASTGTSFTCVKNEDDWSWVPILFLLLFGIMLIVLLVGIALANRRTTEVLNAYGDVVKQINI